MKFPIGAATPLVVASEMTTLGTIELKDVVKGGIKDRFAQSAQDGNQDGDDHRR